MINYERFDTCYGTVQYRNSSGVYLELDNGEPAFAYSFTSLFPGDTVLCSISRTASDDRHATVRIDSTIIPSAA